MNDDLKSGLAPDDLVELEAAMEELNDTEQHILTR